MPVKRLILVGVLLLLAFIAVGFPAAAVWRWVQPQVPELQLAGVSGTLWRGRADQANWNFAPLGELHWQFQPGLELRWQVQLQGPLLNMRGQLHASGETITLNNVQGRWSSTLMRSPLPGAEVDGEFYAQLETIRWQGPQPQRINGKLNWRNARLLAPVNTTLGHINIELNSPRDGLINISLTTAGDEGNPTVSLRGNGRISEGRYDMTVFLRARDRQSNINQWLIQLGTPMGDGSVRLELNGTLIHGDA